MSEREQAAVGIWAAVNTIAETTEDTAAIRAMIAEAGIEPRVHVGRERADFNDRLVMAEYVLGQWADMIDRASPFLNTARNVSLSWYERHIERGEPVEP